MTSPAPSGRKPRPVMLGRAARGDFAAGGGEAGAEPTRETLGREAILAASAGEGFEGEASREGFDGRASGCVCVWVCVFVSVCVCVCVCVWVCVCGFASGCGCTRAGFSVATGGALEAGWLTVA